MKQINQENNGNCFDESIYLRLAFETHKKMVNLTLEFVQHLVENYESFISTYQKRGLLYLLLHRSFSICCVCCDFKVFYFEIDHLKAILLKKKYPTNLIDSCIKSFLNKVYTPKRNVFVKFPFLRSTSLQI